MLWFVRNNIGNIIGLVELILEIVIPHHGRIGICAVATDPIIDVELACRLRLIGDHKTHGAAAQDGILVVDSIASLPLIINGSQIIFVEDRVLIVGLAASSRGETLGAHGFNGFRRSIALNFASPAILVCK